MQYTLAFNDPLAPAIARPSEPPAGWPLAAANESCDNDVTSQDTADEEAAVTRRRELQVLEEETGKIERPKQALLFYRSLELHAADSRSQQFKGVCKFCYHNILMYVSALMY